MIDNLILFICLALLAEILGTVGGFGSSLFFVPVASYFFDYHSVLGMTAVFHVFSNLSKIGLFRHGFDKKLILYLGVPATLFVIAGAILSAYFDSAILELFLSLFLIIISALLFIFPTFELKPNVQNAVSGGILSGLIAGLLGTGGAIRGLVLASYRLKMEVFIATSAVIDLGIDFSRAVVYGMNGYIHKHDLYLLPILLAISILGTYLGKLLLKKISAKQFKLIVLSLIFFTGIASLMKFLFY